MMQLGALCFEFIARSERQRRVACGPELHPVLRDPIGQWASLGNPCSGRPYQEKETTFSAQPCFVTAVSEHAGVFIFMADRWNKDNLPASRSEHAASCVCPI